MDLQAPTEGKGSEYRKLKWGKFVEGFAGKVYEPIGRSASNGVGRIATVDRRWQDCSCRCGE